MCAICCHKNSSFIGKQIWNDQHNTYLVLCIKGIKNFLLMKYTETTWLDLYATHKLVSFKLYVKLKNSAVALSVISSLKSSTFLKM